MYKMIGADGQQYGPVSADQLRRWITEGRVGAETLVQVEGSQDWKALKLVPEFTGVVRPPPLVPGAGGMPPINPAVAGRASNKLAAGICGILLGGFGIHKFILGYSGAGLIMLLVSVLTCGLAYGIMHIIGLLEGIIYLVKSDEEFVRLYVDGRKEWF
jgi:TM2 domain-containing membrane protein YozV